MTPGGRGPGYYNNTMSEEHTHDAIEAFKDKNRGEDWYDEHQDLINNLSTLLKHISGDGETFSPPAVSTDSVDAGSVNTDAASVSDAPTENTDVARKAEVDDLESDIDTSKADDPHGNDQHSEDYIPDSEKGASDGVAELDSNALVREGQIPSLAITDVEVFDDESELTGWSEAQQGDVGVVRDDDENGISYILTTDDETTLDNWQRLKTPDVPVNDVFGRTGSISPESGDYEYSQIDNREHGNEDHSSDYYSDGDPVDVDSVSVDSDSALISVAASGSVDLSDGEATVDTGVSDTDATFYLALGADTSDAKIVGRLFLDGSSGTYQVDLIEDETDIGNPTVDYDILRVR